MRSIVRTRKEIRKGRSGERGMGLLIAMSVLVVSLMLGAALMYLAGSESSSVGRQRGTTAFTYAAQAGLEEARSRMIGYNPQAFAKMVPPVQLPSAVGQVVYILNPAPGEVVNPTDLSAGNIYADNEYANEFLTPITAAVVKTTPSVLQGFAGAPPIAYKWVRITVKTEQSAGVSLSGVPGTPLNNTIPIFFDGKHQNLTQQGAPVYRLTALSGTLAGTLKILQVEMSGIMGGFNYALAAGGQCLTDAAGSIYSITGNVLCNSSMTLVGPMSLNGNLNSSGAIGGTGSISLGSGDSISASSVSGVTVAGASGSSSMGGGASSSSTGAGGSSSTGGSTGSSSTGAPISPFTSPSTPTTAPLPANTLPNPDPAVMLPLVTQTNPIGTCVGGNLVIDLGNTTPPQIFQFTGTSYTTACGTTFNPTNIPANVSFTGTGTLWFSGNPSKVSFYNDFGTATTPVGINVIARPVSATTVGGTELEFRGSINNFAGLLYSQGAIESEGPTGGNGNGSSANSGGCPVLPPPATGPNGFMFNVSGAVIAFGGGSSSSGGSGGGGGGGGGGRGGGNSGVFDTEHCSNVTITYNPNLFTSNPPPGFAGLLANGVVKTTLINWRDVKE
jgi:hypothetical protein